MIPGLEVNSQPCKKCAPHWRYLQTCCIRLNISHFTQHPTFSDGQHCAGVWDFSWKLDVMSTITLAVLPKKRVECFFLFRGCIHNRDPKATLRGSIHQYFPSLVQSVYSPAFSRDCQALESVQKLAVKFVKGLLHIPYEAALHRPRLNSFEESMMTLSAYKR